jgi:hypothetical protein
MQIHAEEIRVCSCIIVQPAGEFAPQRREKNRRTMPYEDAQQAIVDAASEGHTSTYHASSEIRVGSTVILRPGQHDITDTLIMRRAVTIEAEEDATAEDCVLVCDGLRGLLQV